VKQCGDMAALCSAGQVNIKIIQIQNISLEFLNVLFTVVKINSTNVKQSTHLFILEVSLRLVRTTVVLLE
jgi:hypothetical protein